MSAKDNKNSKKKYDQTKYNKAWEEKNRERRRYLSYRSSSRTFIKNYSTYEDLEDLKIRIEERIKVLDEEEMKRKSAIRIKNNILLHLKNNSKK